eukprot:2827709-Rhodomonas_salina.1
MGRQRKTERGACMCVMRCKAALSTECMSLCACCNASKRGAASSMHISAMRISSEQDGTTVASGPN